MARIFVSYSRKDEQFARRLAASLSDLGADVWIDVEDIPAGMKWSTAIQQGLNLSEAMLIVISPDSMASTNVEDEWQYYLDKGKLVIPVLWRPAEVHFQLNRLQYIDFYDQEYDVALKQLHSELKRHHVPLNPISSVTDLSDSTTSLPHQEPLPLRKESDGQRWIPYALGAVLLIFVVGAALLLSGVLGEDDGGGFPTESAQQISTEAPIESPSDTPAPTDTLTPTESPGDTPTQTETSTNMPTQTESPADTPAPIASSTNTLTPTESPADTPAQTESPTNTPSQTASPAATNTPALALPVGVEGQILFTSDVGTESGFRTAASEIMLLDLADESIQNLTNNEEIDWGADWSPDGTRITFISNPNLSLDIYVMDADGSNAQVLDQISGSPDWPAWSPNGSWIAYTIINPGDSEIAIMNANGSNPRELTSNIYNDTLPRWSPDSTRIVFASVRDGDSEIYMMSMNGENIHHLTENEIADTSPAWSPDGSQIAFSSNRDGNFELYVMDTNGSNVRRLTQNDYNDRTPAWSPDGLHIVFAADGEGNQELYVMDASGDNVQRLTSTALYDESYPKWRP